MVDQKLLTFLKLCETMNYHETARLLNMTQPAVTQHIRALEDEYGCRVFFYDHRRLTKTKEAETLEAYARSAVFNEGRLKVSLGKSEMERFRIGATKSIGEYMIGEMVSSFLSDRGRTADITIDNTEHLLGMLDKNLIDFALIEGSFSKLKYGYRLFRNEPMTGICAVGTLLTAGVFQLRICSEKRSSCASRGRERGISSALSLPSTGIRGMISIAR